MQTQTSIEHYARMHAFHGSKRLLLGNRAGQIPPAWRTHGVPPAQVVGCKGKASTESGSRIFLSRLPVDVGEKEVEELFNKTVGPLKESFLVYNSQGKSKGMAVVTFQRPGDAIVARAKYNGRVVDGRRPIKIEILVDDTPLARAAQAPGTPTLLDRLAPPTKPKFIPASSTVTPHPDVSHYVQQAAPSASVHQPVAPIKQVPIPPRRLKQKKGPKRLNKRQPVTVADLDQEMEEYRASAPDYLGL